MSHSQSSIFQHTTGENVIDNLRIAQQLKVGRDVLTVTAGERGSEPLMQMKGISGQTNDLFNIELSDGTEMFTITAAGLMDFEGNRVTNIADPTDDQDAATKAYVTSVTGGIKAAVRAATTAAGTLASDYENGDTIDGVILATGNRILIKNQADGTENGVYTVNASGAPTRATDFDTGNSVAGAYMPVNEGTLNADSLIMCTNDDGSDVVGTDVLTFLRLSSLAAGDGLVTSGGGAQYDVNVDGTTLEISGDIVRAAAGLAGTGLTMTGGGGNNIDIDASQPTITSVGQASQALTLPGDVSITDNTSATSTSTGALKVTGGISTQENLYVGGNTVIAGDLTVSGTTTTVESTTTTMSDNLVVYNSGPGSTKDSGFLVDRFQDPNNGGTGDVISDTAAETSAGHGGNAQAGSSTTITLNAGANASDDYYNDWWIHLTGGTGSGQVRRIKDYVGATKVATIYADSDGAPDGDDFDTSASTDTTYSLFNRPLVGVLYDESSDQVGFIATASDPGATQVTVQDYVDIRAGGATFDDAVTISSSTNATDKDTGALIIANGGLGVEQDVHVGGLLSVTDRINDIYHASTVAEITSQLSAIDTAGGGTLQIAPGDYTATVAFTVPSNTRVRGAGYITHITNNTTNTWEVSAGASNVVIEEMRLTASAAADISNVFVADCDNFILRRLWMTCGRQGIESSNNTATNTNSIIRECLISGQTLTTSCISLFNSQNLLITELRIDTPGTTTDAIFFNDDADNANCIISNLNISGAFDDAIRISGTNHLIEGIIIEGSPANYIELNNADKCKIDGCTFSGIASGDTAILINSNSTDCIITDNSFSGTDGTGISVSANGTIMESNKFDGLNIGLDFADAETTRCVVSDNSCENCTSNYTNSGGIDSNDDNIFQGNQPLSETMALGSGNVSPSLFTVESIASGINASRTGTLADGLFKGQKKIIRVDSFSSGSYVLTVTSAKNEGTITFDAEEESVELVWDGDNWYRGDTGHDITMPGDVTVSGNLSVTGTTTYESAQIIDVDSTEAFLVRKNGDAGDVFTVDTTNSQVRIPQNEFRVGSGSTTFGDINKFWFHEFNSGATQRWIYLGRVSDADASTTNGAMHVTVYNGRTRGTNSPTRTEVDITTRNETVDFDFKHYGEISGTSVGRSHIIVFSDEATVGTWNRYHVFLLCCAFSDNTVQVEYNLEGDPSNTDEGDITAGTYDASGSPILNGPDGSSSGFTAATWAEVASTIDTNPTMIEETGTLNVANQIIVDSTSTEALLVRKDADGGDIFTVNSTSGIVTVADASDPQLVITEDGSSGSLTLIHSSGAEGKITMTSASSSTMSINPATGADTDTSIVRFFREVDVSNGTAYVQIHDADGTAGVSIRLNPQGESFFNNTLAIQDTTNSTSNSTGAFTVDGGMGVVNDVFIGGALNVDSVDSEVAGTLTLGPSTATKVEIADTGVETEVQGDLDVLGALTLGTQLAVAEGGTGATTLGSNRVLTGNGTSAITDEANLTFDGSELLITGSLDIQSSGNADDTVMMEFRENGGTTEEFSIRGDWSGTGTANTLSFYSALDTPGDILTMTGGKNVSIPNGILFANNIDANTASTLLLGSSTATKVEIADTGVQTEIQGDLDVLQGAVFNSTVTADDIDSTTATTLLLGKATATKVEIADTGVQTEIQGDLDVIQGAVFNSTVTADDIDSTTATTLLIGKATATKVEIADASVETEIQGTLDVLESATFQASTIVDSDSTEAFLVRKNGDPAGGDIFTVDASSTTVTVGNTNASQSDVATFTVTGNDDAIINIIADADNATETHNAILNFSQDNGATTAIIELDSSNQFNINATGTTNNAMRFLTDSTSRMEVSQAGVVSVVVATNSTSKDTGALVVNSGGLGVELDTFIGGTLNVDAVEPTSATTLTIGPSTATKVEIADTGVQTEIQGDLDVIQGAVFNSTVTADDIDSTTATTLLLGKATATRVEIADTGIVTDIEGSLEVAEGVTFSSTLSVNDIDTSSATTLLLGKSVATKVEIADTGVQTEIQGDLDVIQGAVFNSTVTADDIDSTTATTLLLGKATATKVEIADAGVTTEIQGPLTVDNVDSVTATTLLLGSSTATKVEIADTGVQTEIQGDLDVIQGAVFNSTVTADDIDSTTATTLLLGKSTATKVEIADSGVETNVQGSLTVDGDFVNGDSGSVSWAGDFTTAVTTTVRVRRLGPIVWVEFEEVTGTSDTTTFAPDSFTVPAGSRPQTATVYFPALVEDNDIDQMGLISIDTSGNIVVYPTTDPDSASTWTASGTKTLRKVCVQYTIA